MPHVQAVPLLLYTLAGLVLSLITWGLLRNYEDEADKSSWDTWSKLILWLSVLAAFGIGVFLAYVLLFLLPPAWG